MVDVFSEADGRCKHMFYKQLFWKIYHVCFPGKFIFFSDCCFQEHFWATTSAFYPIAKHMPKGDIKTIQSTVLRHSFIYYPETSLCHLWTDIFNRVLEWNNFSSETLHRILLVKKPAAAPAHICTNGLSLSTPAWVIPFVAFA